MSRITVTERVAKGAALLDEKLPDWWIRIDLADLSLRSSCRCILGQLYSGRDTGNPFAEAARGLGVYDDAHAYGFDTSAYEEDDDWACDEDDDFLALTAEWKRAVIARRQAVLASV
jgi:hypothetical protein